MIYLRKHALVVLLHYERVRLGMLCAVTFDLIDRVLLDQHFCNNITKICSAVFTSITFVRGMTVVKPFFNNAAVNILTFVTKISKVLVLHMQLHNELVVFVACLIYCTLAER